MTFGIHPQLILLLSKEETKQMHTVFNVFGGLALKKCESICLQCVQFQSAYINLHTSSMVLGTADQHHCLLAHLYNMPFTITTH